MVVVAVGETAPGHYELLQTQWPIALSPLLQLIQRNTVVGIEQLVKQQSVGSFRLISLFEELEQPNQKIPGPIPEFNRRPGIVLDDEPIPTGYQLQLFVIAEVVENAPAYLHVLHLHAPLVHGYETLQVDVVHVVALQLHPNQLLYLADVVAVQLAVEHSLLQLT